MTARDEFVDRWTITGLAYPTFSAELDALIAEERDRIVAELREGSAERSAFMDGWLAAADHIARGEGSS
jgi:hypothetical protein